MSSAPQAAFGDTSGWRPERPRLRLFPLLGSWLAAGIALMVAAGLLPGVHIDDFWGALLIAAIVAVLNVIIPPVLAALRLPLTLVLGFLLVLIERHPQLISALRAHPHVGWLLVRSAEHGAVALGAAGVHYLVDGRVDGDDPLATFSPHAPQHLLRTDGFSHVADIMVGSFYDPELDEGCAFEELISFHGGIGGFQTRPFILHPSHLEAPPAPILGAATVHGILAGWRHALQGERVADTPIAAVTPS